MRKKSIIFFSILPVLAITALFLFCDLGEQPLGPTIGKDTVTIIDDIIIDSILTWESGTMEIFVDPSDLPASSEKTASVKVRLFNNLHNPIVGREIFFAATHGLIPSGAITDNSGIAAVMFTSEPIDTEASIFAWIYEVDKKGDSTQIVVKQTVTISGITVSVIPSSNNALINTIVPVTIFVTDADGKPVSNKPVYLSGGKVDTLTTLGNGTVTTSVTSAVDLSVVIITAMSQNVSETSIVKFWKVIPDDIIDPVVGIRDLRIFSSKAQLKADNTDYATITAIYINEKNNPAVGDSIQFSSDLGIIQKFGVIDPTGRTSVTLQSTPVNGICNVEAFAVGTEDSALTKVIFSGVSLQLTADPIDLKTGQYSTVQALLTDASNHPIEGDTVSFTVTGTGAVFEDGSTTKDVVPNTNGIAEVKVTSSSASTARVKADALHVSDSTAIHFTNSILTLTASPTIINIGGSAYSTLRATYRDANNALVSGAWIHFYTNAGELSRDSAVTVDGIATSNLYSAQFANIATVQASASDGVAETTVEFAAINADSVDLKISPDNISVNGGVAVLTVTVIDPQGNMVSGATVNFKILKGPGGDEYIDKPAVISKDGIARTNLHAGSQPSQYRGCEVAASVGAIADTSKMTISGEPYVITVSRPQDDTVVVTNVGQINETTFKYYVGAVVQDVNGNNVADGMEVHFSAVISGMQVGVKRFVRWDFSLDDIKPVYTYDPFDVYFEDINNNLVMDPNIDLKLDFNNAVATRGDDVNGDGIMDYDPTVYDLFYDFDFNGVCDVNNPEPYLEMSKKYITELIGYDTTITPRVDTTITPTVVGNIVTYDTTYAVVYDTVITDNTVIIDSTYEIWADLNNNGKWDKSELYNDHNNDKVLDTPASGDFIHTLWEMRPQFFERPLYFDKNDFAVVIEASAVTKDGVAHATLTYPRQLAHRLLASINAEINGIRDKDGERFGLPVLIGGK